MFSQHCICAEPSQENFTSARRRRAISLWMLKVPNECSRTGCKNERLISPLKQKLSDIWLKLTMTWSLGALLMLKNALLL